MSVGSAGTVRPDFSRAMLSWLGAYVIFLIGMAHALESSGMFDAGLIWGFLFLANFAASCVAAAFIAWKGAVWAWVLGDVVAGGAPEDETWTNLPAGIALALEATFLGVSVLALTSTGSRVVQAEQEAIEKEQAPPFLVEDIARLREGMEPDVHDLKIHLTPRTMVEKRRQALQTRIRRAMRGALLSAGEAGRRSSSR